MGARLSLIHFPGRPQPCLVSTFGKPACHFLEVSYFQRSTAGWRSNSLPQPERPLAGRLSPGGPLPSRTSRAPPPSAHGGVICTLYPPRATLCGTHDGLMRAALPSSIQARRSVLGPSLLQAELQGWRANLTLTQDGPPSLGRPGGRPGSMEL